MRRIRLLLLGLLPVLLTTTAFLALVSAAPQAQGADQSACDTGRHKWANPTTLYVGQEAEVTSVITGACPAYDLPIDMVLLVDQSNSMTKGSGQNTVPSPGAGTAGPVPIDTQVVPVLPSPGTGEPPPTKPPEPVPTGFVVAPGGFQRQPGLAQVPIIPSPTPPPRFTPGPSPTTDLRTPPTPGGNVGTPVPGVDPTRESIIRDQEEAAGDEDLIRAVQEAIADFLDEIEDDAKDGKVRLGLAAFNDRGLQLVPLTDDVQRVRSRLSRLRGQGNTRVDLGLSTATRMLVGVDVRGRTDLDHRKLIVLFSDGKYDRRITARLRTRDGLDIITVAAGRTANLVSLRQLATDNSYALDLRDRKELVVLFRRIAPRQRLVAMQVMTIEDTLASNMVLVPDSAVPPPDRVVNGQTLQWDFQPPSLPITITYRVQPQEPGMHPVSELAHASWTDSEKRSGDVPFPAVELEVMALPTPTPTPTPTATSINPTNTPEVTPTPKPIPLADLYLPIALNEVVECKPSQQTVDVAMIVDTSMSMGEPTQAGGKTKLQAAIDAMRQLVGLLKPGDQAAVIWFNDDTSVMVPLTSDHASLAAALDGLWATQAPGTHIHEGLLAALNELVSVRHVADSNRAVVLVTDGRQDEIVGAQAVRDAAAAVKAAGIEVYAVGLGANVDAVLLGEVASSPATLSLAPNAEDLEAIYRRIAIVIPCPQP